MHPLCMNILILIVARITASIFAFGIAAFCVFGFLASFEYSLAKSWPWHLGYGIVGIGSLIAAILLLKGAWTRGRSVKSAR